MRQTCAWLVGGVVLVGLVGEAWAQPASPTPAPAPAPKQIPSPAPRPAQPPPAVAPQPSIPPAPVATPVPVPDGPVVNKQELEGGLIVEDIKIGDGYEIKPGGAFVAFYHGTLKDGGTVFDSAFDRGEPIVYTLDRMIDGWQKGIPGMKIGGVRRLTVPWAMAYGDKPHGDKIPAKSDLVFVIQLVDAIQIEDIKVGDGEQAAPLCVAVTSYTIKDADGKEIEKAEMPKPYIWVPNEYGAMSAGITGMKTGGTRKLIVPKQFNVTSPQAGSSRPQGVPVTIEVTLHYVRNLSGVRR